VGHFVDAGERLEGADQDGASFAFGLTGDIEAIVIAVDEVDVGVPGRSEKNGGAGGVAGGGVGGGIEFSEVGFNFDDAGREVEGTVVAEENLTEEGASDAAGIAGVEGARERGGSHRSGCRSGREKSKRS